jgi:hypothetical protein
MRHNHGRLGSRPQQERPTAGSAVCIDLQVEMKALDELIAQKLPRLSAHFNALEVDVSILATDWFLTLYATCMPSETVRWLKSLTPILHKQHHGSTV